MFVGFRGLFDVVDGMKTTNVKAVPFSSNSNYSLPYGGSPDLTAFIAKICPPAKPVCNNLCKI